MMKAKTIRKFIGVLGVLIILVPLSGLPGWWKDALTIFFGALVLLAVVYKPMLIEIFRLVRELQNEKKGNSTKKRVNRIRRPHLRARKKKVDTPDEQEEVITDENEYDER